MNENNIDINSIKEMLESCTPKKNPQLDRNKTIFDMLAAKVNAAYDQGFHDGYSQGLMAGPAMNPSPEGPSDYPYPYYKVTWTRPVTMPARQSHWTTDTAYGCTCCGGSCNHQE